MIATAERGTTGVDEGEAGLCSRDMITALVGLSHQPSV